MMKNVKNHFWWNTISNRKMTFLYQFDSKERRKKEKKKRKTERTKVFFWRIIRIIIILIMYLPK